MYFHTQVAYDDLKWFSCELLKSMYLKSLTQGNMDVSTAQETINEAVKSFSFKQLPPDALIKVSGKYIKLWYAY